MGKSTGKGEFATKKEWDAYKADVTRVARSFSRILREIRSGMRETKTVKEFPIPVQGQKEKPAENK
jgi:hypothetical protein